MEHQMVSLKQSVRESEAQREKAELKLAEAIARDHQNQVNRENLFINSLRTCSIKGLRVSDALHLLI
jgi:hypothetical protein